MPHSFVEYGVIVDRTDKGLGYHLAAVRRDRVHAEDVAKTHENAVVKSRLVMVSDWEELDD